MRHLDEIEQFHKEHCEQEQARMLLLMAGIEPPQNTNYADKSALRNLFCDIVLSNEYQKLVAYLRM